LNRCTVEVLPSCFPGFYQSRVYRIPQLIEGLRAGQDLVADHEARCCFRSRLRGAIVIRFDERLVKYDFGELDEVALAYAITIHKSQGSEFPAVVIPLATQHYMLLQRNLIYTGITRGKRLLVLIGQKKALGIAVRNDRPQGRYSWLLTSLRSDRREALA